jgi:hypothetical protein
MSNYNIYFSRDAAWKKIVTHVTLKQRGLCYHCRESMILKDDCIVSVKSARKTRYYHKHCIEQMYI